MKFEFTAVLKGRHSHEEIEDGLYEAGCDDALLCSTDGTMFLQFEREADLTEQAIQTAVDNLNAAGYQVESIEEAGFVSISEAANRIGVSRQALHAFAQRKRSDGN